MKFKFGIAILLFLTFLISCLNKDKPKDAKPTNTQEYISTDVDRTSITFILGADENARNPYYELANFYYRLNDSDKTEVVIDTLFTILEVQEYLKNNPPQNGKPWGLINLVSHGNEFVDLSVKVYPHGPRTSTESLKIALNDSIIHPLSSRFVDSNTVLFLHGCAVGQNQDLLNELSKAFSGPNNAIRVKASKLFEYYAYLSKNQNPNSVRRYFAKVWYGFYHLDSIFDEQKLIKQFVKQSPKETINWKSAIKKQYQQNPSEVYHITFIVPLLWEEFYDFEKDLPTINSRQKQLAWINKHPDFLISLNKTKIPLEYYQFKFFKMKYRDDNGDFYSLKVKAKAGVFCLIQPQLSHSDTLNLPFEPLNPKSNDSLFFGFSKN